MIKVRQCCDKIRKDTNTSVIVCNNPGPVTGALHQVIISDHQQISECRNISSDRITTILSGKLNNIKLVSSVVDESNVGAWE